MSLGVPVSGGSVGFSKTCREQGWMFYEFLQCHARQHLGAPHAAVNQLLSLGALYLGCTSILMWSLEPLESARQCEQFESGA